MYLTRRVVLPGLAGSGWGEHFCPKGQDPWHPRDPRPGWVCVFKQELLDWPLHLGDREVRTLKPMSQKTPQKNAGCLQMSGPLGLEEVELRVKGKVTHTL